jgi:hypothetical protein
MANTAIVPFAQAPVPAHIKKAIDSGASNIPEKLTVNQLSFRGKVWRQVIDGEERALLNKEDEPVSAVHVVVLNHNKARSRSYYEGAYVEGKATPPACWSNDGESPDSSVKEPQSSSCAKCPQAVKGSKITANGKETTACAVFKRLAVIPLSDLTCPPLLLRLAQTSMWDKNNEENEGKGYYAWDQYLDMLRARGASHTGLVATKIRFDSRMAYPKLVFAASRWLEDEEIDLVRPMWEGEATLKLLNASEVAAAERKPATPKDDDEEEAPAVKPSKAKKAAPAPVEEEEEDDTPPPPKKAKKAAAPPVEEEADEEEEAPPPPKKSKVKPAPAPAAEEEDEEEEAPPPPKKAKKAAAPPVEEEEEEDEPAPVAKKAKKAAPVEDEEEAAPAPAAKKAKGKGDGLADLVEEFDD